MLLKTQLGELEPCLGYPLTGTARHPRVEVPCHVLAPVRVQRPSGF